MKENRSLFHNGKFLHYTLTKKDITKINLRIDDKGLIKVSAPNFVDIRSIEKFIYKNIDFIEKNVDKRKNDNSFNLDSGVISLFGVPFYVEKNISLKNSVKIATNRVIVSYKKVEDIERLIKKVVREFAIHYFEKRILELSDFTGIPFTSLKIKWLKTKWGHCDSNKNIVLNCKLINYSKDTIDYVIIHELCHVIHMNHSREYWSLVAKFCPNWKTLRCDLKM